MLDPIWIATALGLGGGVVLAYAIGNAVLPRAVAKSEDMLLFVRLAFAGTVAALLPALFLSIVIGGTLGGAWGERVFGRLGIPLSGVPAGLALGIALVFALVVLGGGASGFFLGKAVVCYRQRQAR
jgi:hypothetical protein